MLVIRDLVKTYSSGVRALRGVSVELPPGVFGLLGPNGSGKTTLMKIVATLLEPDSGTIEMNGADLITHKNHTRQMLGYLPQDFGLYPTLTARQMLDYFSEAQRHHKQKRHRYRRGTPLSLFFYHKDTRALLDHERRPHCLYMVMKSKLFQASTIFPFSIRTIAMPVISTGD